MDATMNILIFSKWPPFWRHFNVLLGSGIEKCSIAKIKPRKYYIFWAFYRCPSLNINRLTADWNIHHFDFIFASDDVINGTTNVKLRGIGQIHQTYLYARFERNIFIGFWDITKSALILHAMQYGYRPTDRPTLDYTKGFQSCSCARNTFEVSFVLVFRRRILFWGQIDKTSNIRGAFLRFYVIFTCFSELTTAFFHR